MCVLTDRGMENVLKLKSRYDPFSALIKPKGYASINNALQLIFRNPLIGK